MTSRIRTLSLLTLGLTLALGGCNSKDSVKAPTPLAYPASEVKPLVEEIHGVKVEDPYRWLEENNAATEDWVKRQQAFGDQYLADIPNKQVVMDRITTLWNFEKVGAPFEHGDNRFVFRNNGLQSQNVLFVSENGAAERVLLDPNTLSADGTVALSGVSVSGDGKTLAFGVSKSGSDWQEWAFIDVASGKKLGDSLKWIKFSRAEWAADNSGVYYSRYDAPKGGDILSDVNYNQKVYFHRLGDAQERDTLVYERPDNPEWGFASSVSDDGNYLLISISVGTDSRNRFFYKPLKDKSLKVVELMSELEAEYQFLGNQGPVFFFKTDLEAPKGRVIAVDTRDPAKSQWQTVIPESDNPIAEVSIIGGHLVVSYLQDVLGQLSVFNMDGSKREDVKMPGLGKIAGPYGKPTKPYFYYVFNSYVQPETIYKYDLDKSSNELFSAPKVSFDPESYVSEQVFYTSKDGTRIPMILSYKKGLKKDGNNPTLLYAYGGFSISMTPRFSPATIAWLDMGGIYAVPALRGGSEYGEEWHKAGMFGKKQNVFDDYYGAAEYLINEKYTQSSKLGAYGRSNGGLLMGAAVTQRPELFAAVLPAVGVLDMLRFQKFTIGWAWTAEYGSADNAADFPYLMAYSPYHNVKGGAFPATMVMTADHDDRVVPLHSFKFGAMLQAKQQGDAPVIMRIESKAGHGAGKPTSMQIAEFADIYAFLWHNFGLTLPQKL